MISKNIILSFGLFLCGTMLFTILLQFVFGNNSWLIPPALFLSAILAVWSFKVREKEDKESSKTDPFQSTFLAMSDFAARRHKKGKGRSYTTLSNQELIGIVISQWDHAIPGAGETGLTRKILVPLPEPYFEYFFCPTVKLEKNMKLAAKVSQRQDGEDLYVTTYIKHNWLDRLFGNTVVPETPKKVEIVCYSKEALLENGGERSSLAAWEIVAILCSDSEEKQPMYPLTMARNFLEKSGGTFSDYTAKEFAESIYYWSQRINAGE